MQEISLHILDIVENSVRGAATKIDILIIDNDNAGTLSVTISDNGEGLSSDALARVFDPFYTTRTSRQIGMGLPLIRDAANATGGGTVIESLPDKGTTVTAVFNKRHIDCPPLGDVIATLKTLVVGHPMVDFLYEYHMGRERLVLDTAALSREYGGKFREDVLAICKVVGSLENLLPQLEQTTRANLIDWPSDKTKTREQAYGAR